MDPKAKSRSWGGGVLNKEGKPVSSPTKGNKAKRYFKRSVFLSPPIQEYIRNPLQFSHAESEKIDSEVATLLEKGALNMVKPVSGQF